MTNAAIAESARSLPAAPLLFRLKAWFADYRLARRTFDELNALNDRELADIGLSRYEIRHASFRRD